MGHCKAAPPPTASRLDVTLVARLGSLLPLTASSIVVLVRLADFLAATLGDAMLVLAAA